VTTKTAKKTKAKSKTKKRERSKLATGRRVPITDKEITKATKLAKRKSGVTRRDLATKLGVSEGRAANILKRIDGIKSAPLGGKAGKACRTLVFRI
jgi:ribosomal protein S25